MSKSPSNFSKDILKKIKSEDIKQRPSWHFWIKNVIFWSIFGLSAFIGGRAIGVMGRLITDADLPFLLGAKGAIMPRIISLFPLFWIIFFLLFLLFANYGLHHTKRGYKLGTTKLIGINLAISLIIGSCATILGDGERFEKMVHEKAPIFKKIEENRIQAWNNPEEGRLAGTIVIVQDDRILLLNDFTDSTWTINYSEAQWRRQFDLREGIKVTIVGHQNEKLNFVAEKIGPWHKKPKK